MTAVEVEFLARACAMATWCLVAAYVWTVYRPWTRETDRATRSRVSMWRAGGGFSSYGDVQATVTSCGAVVMVRRDGTTEVHSPSGFTRVDVETIE